MTTKMNLAKLIASLFICLIAISCSKDNSQEPPKTIFDIQGENGFVGTVDGTNAFIAVLVANEEALVYVCNGEEGIYEWFKGDITDPENISLQNGNGAKVVGNFTANTFTGTVVLTDGTSHLYTATANIGNEAGVFQVFGDLAEQEGVIAGWILDTKNKERGSFRLNSVFQATPAKPSTNRFLFRNNSFPIRRFFTYHPDSITVVR